MALTVKLEVMVNMEVTMKLVAMVKLVVMVNMKAVIKLVATVNLVVLESMMAMSTVQLVMMALHGKMTRMACARKPRKLLAKLKVRNVCCNQQPGNVSHLLLSMALVVFSMFMSMPRC